MSHLRPPTVVVENFRPLIEGGRYPVKRALVLNPATPVHIAVRLATTLRRGDLLEIARDAHLPAPLRAHAAELLARKRR